MTSTELIDEIAANVSNRVNEEEYRSRIADSAGACAECRVQFEAEVGRRFRIKPIREQTSITPLPAASASGNAASNDERQVSHASDSPVGSRSRDWISRFEADWLSTGGHLIAVILIAGSLWLLGAFTPKTDAVLPGHVAVDRPGGTSPDRTPRINALNQAVKNLAAIGRGDLVITHDEDDPNALREYFKDEGVDYDIDVARSRLPLSGGFVSRHADMGTERTFAHWVYVQGDDRIVVFPLPVRVLTSGRVFYLTQDALARLRSGERLWEDFGDGGTVCAVLKGEVVYVVASTLARDELRASYPGL